MKLSQRDLTVVRHVAMYRQVKATQLRRLFFHDRSKPPFYRCMDRLISGGWLRSLGRFAEDDQGGAVPYIYCAGPKWEKHVGVRVRKYRTPDRHMLRQSEVYVLLVEAERDGLLAIQRHQVEVPLRLVRADLLIELESLAFYVEVEVCDKDISHIEQKCADYIKLWHASNAFPYVLLVAPDKLRLNEMLRVIQALGEDAQLFRACLMDTLVETIKAID